MTIRVPNLFAHAADALRRFQNSSVKHPSESFLDALFGPVSASGARVTSETALGVATVFACVSLLSRVVSTLPLKLYERDGEARNELPTHPVSLLLAVRPNPEQTAADVRGALMANLALRGNAYAVIVRDRAGRPAQLWPAKQVEPYRNDKQQLRYRVTQDGGRQRDVPFSDMLHIRGLTFDGGIGIGPLMARECIGLAIALEDNASSFFGNQSRPGLLLETAAPLKENQIKEIYDYLKKYHEGPTNAYRTLILNGCKVASHRTTNEQSQFDETRNRQAVEVCKLFGVPPHKVGILDKATFSNIEQQQIQFSVDTIQPLCVQWEQAMAGALLTDEERARGLFLKHNLNALQRGDFQTRVNGYVQMIQNGVLSPNEVRALEDLDPREGGDVYLTPLNMSQGGKDNDPPPGKPPANRMNGHKIEEPLMS